MSLQNLATQMAAQGRGPDRTLVHMSPKEVQGLQALAMAHGGSLTINPETGLPEAGFLEDILPAVAGFALNAFAPGVGTAVGSLFGLGGAAGTALTVGGIAGLASGSLEKGIMAGMGAYGGAGLGGSLMDAGTSALTQAGVDAAGGAAALGGDATGIAQKVADTGTFDKLKAGFGAAASTPKDFLQDNKWLLGAAMLPGLMGGDKDEGTGAPKTTRYNRRYEKDPVTGALYEVEATPVDGDTQYGTPSKGVTFGGVAPRKVQGMADGGEVMNPMTEEQRLNSIATETNAPPVISDSQRALDYLMGKTGATNPMLFTKKATTGPVLPDDFSTRKGGHYMLDALTNTYTWVPDPAAANSGLAALQNRGQKSGEVVPRNPEDQARVDAFMDEEDAKDIANGDPVGTTRAARIDKDLGWLVPAPLKWLASLNKPEDPDAPPTIGFLDRLTAPFTGLNPETGGYRTGFNPEALGTGVSTQSQDAATNAQVEAAAQANAANTLNVGDAQANAAADSARAYQAAISEGTRGAPSYSNDSGGGNYGGPSGGYGSSYGSGSVGGFSGGAGDGGNYGGSSGGYGGSYGSGSVGGYAHGGIASLAGGGLGSLGGYSDGGQLLKGPGDGVSDSIPAKIAGNQPARLANNEFVIPARIVSELGNGSTDAGARELYKMMARIQAGRKKSIGKGKIAVDSKAVKHLPA